MKSSKHSDITIDLIKPGFFVKIPITKGVVVVDTNPPVKLDLRTFASQVDALLSGELLAKKARGGKVSGTALISHLKGEVTGFKFKRYSKDEILEKNGKIKQSFMNDFFTVIQQMKKADKVDKSEINRIKTVKDLEKTILQMAAEDFKDNEYGLAANLNSKIQAMQLAAFATDEFLEFAYNYASSSIKDLSAPFIKIGK